MAKFSLIPFDKLKAPDILIEVEINQNEESFFISYRINLGLENVDLGSPSPNKNRLLKLWEKTCFELFIKNENDSYLEFNFSPNFEWNCFYFNKKGDQLMPLNQMQMPKLDILLSNDHYLLFADIKKGQFPENFLSKNQQNHVGISCVIKDKNEKLSYWALVHCDTRPNFHHFDSFIYKF